MKHRSLKLPAALLALTMLAAACAPGDGSPKPPADPPTAVTQEESESVTEEPEFVIPENTVVSFVDYNEICQARSDRQRLSYANVSLLYDGVSLPRAGSTCYLTVGDSFSLNDLYALTAEITLPAETGDSAETASAVKPRILLDAHLKDVGVEPMMKHSTAVEVFLYTDEGYLSLDLIFTTLPVLTISDAPGLITIKPAGCRMELFSSRDGSPKIRRAESDATIKIRGASSSSLAKTGLKLELQKDGESRKLPLLGMRNDDDWILYPSYSDNTKVRDVVGWHLWERMMAGQKYGGALQTRYVEMILNGKYNGLYVLMEKFDDKTLDLEDDDVLFKCISWDVPTGSRLRSQLPRAVGVSSIEKKFPDPEDAVEGTWDRFADYVEISYETDGPEFREKIGSVIDMENQLDYWLFLNLTMACDNTWKNTYYAQIDDRIYAYPWDLDITFGLVWSGVYEENYTHEDPGTTRNTYDFQCGRRLIKYVDGAADYVKERWQQLKADGIADADTIIADAHAQWDLLHSSGAYQRNRDRWPATSVTDSLDYFDNIVRTREAWLDDYIESLD